MAFKEVEMDCKSQAIASAVMGKATELSVKTDCMKVDDKFVVTLYDISPDQLNQIKKFRATINVSTGFLNVTEKAAGTVIDASNFVAQTVAVPTIKAGAKIVFGAGKCLGKVLAQTAGVLVGNAAKAVNETREELAHDPDISRAKSEMKKLFRVGEEDGSIRIVKDEKVAQ